MANLIYQFPMPIPVTNGNYPQFKFAVFGDNLSTVTTAGYLQTSAIESGIPLSNADIIMALYGFNQQTLTGTFGIFTVSISASTGLVTLASWGNPGDAILPTTANYLAHFTNTTGTISSGAGNVIQPGNISAGLSGTAGTVSSFPGTASKGSLILAGVANTGNTNTTISNAAMGQASVVSIPDPGASTANFILSAIASGPQTMAGGLTISSSNLIVSAGNVTAGSSGNAGTVSSFPTTASKGSLILAAVANTGNTTTTISNLAMGQASVISIPDPAGATADFVIAPAALVSGNLVQASGTTGLVADSGVSTASISGAVTQLGQLQQISVTLNTAAVIAAFATPQVLIPAAAGKVAIVHSANVYTASTGNTAFATGTAPIIQYGTTVHGAGTIATGAGLVTGDIEAAASQVRTLGPAASAVYTGITNTAVTFSCASAYTAGTGTSITFTLVYELITATV